jgi:hypothetical protein
MQRPDTKRIDWLNRFSAQSTGFRAEGGLVFQWRCGRIRKSLDALMKEFPHAKSKPAKKR